MGKTKKNAKEKKDDEQVSPFSYYKFFYSCEEEDSQTDHQLPQKTVFFSC